MSSSTDPSRLTDNGSARSARLRRLLEAAREDGPDTAQTARLAARLGPLLDPPAGPGGSPPPPRGGNGSGGSPVGAPPGAPPRAPSPWWSLPAGKVGASLLVIVLGAGAGTGLFARTGPEPPEARAPATGMSVPTPVSAAPALSSPIEPATVETAGAPAAELPAMRAGSPPWPEPSVSVPATPPRSRQPRSFALHAPPSPSGAPSSAPPEGRATEMDLLDRAQRALESSPEAALSLAEEHAARFASGALAPEREVIAISALVALDRRDEALSRAERFCAAYPGSAYQRRIDLLLAR